MGIRCSDTPAQDRLFLISWVCLCMTCSFPLDTPTLELISTHPFTMFSLGRGKKKENITHICRADAGWKCRHSTCCLVILSRRPKGEVGYLQSTRAALISLSAHAVFLYCCFLLNTARQGHRESQRERNTSPQQRRRAVITVVTQAQAWLSVCADGSCERMETADHQCGCGRHLKFLSCLSE